MPFDQHARKFPLEGRPVQRTSPPAGIPVFPPPKEPLIAPRKDLCRECWGCVRHCPVQAIRVVDRHSEVIAERCVACGICVTSCGSAGHMVRDDTGRVLELLAADEPVVAVLASEFPAALHPMTPPEVEAAL
jgi:ferredoxin